MTQRVLRPVMAAIFVCGPGAAMAQDASTSNAAAEAAASGSTTQLPPLEITAQKKAAASKQAKAKPASAVAQPQTEPLSPPPGTTVETTMGTTGTIGNPPPPFAGGQVATGSRVGMFGNKSLFDVPFSTVSITSEKIANDSADTVMDVLINDPSVQGGYQRSSIMDSFSVRGFSAGSSDFAHDGLFGLASTYGSPLYAVERVELLKGPNALLSGASPYGSVGGTVNLVPKRAQDEDITRVTTSYTSDSIFGTDIDLGRRYGSNKEWGVRINGHYEEGDANYDTTEITTKGLAIALDYRGDRFRWTFDAWHDDPHQSGDQSGTTIDPSLPIPRPPNNRTSWYQPWEFDNPQNSVIMSRAEYDIADNWTVYAAAGKRWKEMEGLTWFPNIINSDGDSETAFEFYSHNYEHSESAETGIRGEFATGPLTHNLVVNASKIWNESGGVGLLAQFGGLDSNIYDPTYYPMPDISGFDDLPQPKRSAFWFSSVAIADTVSILDGAIAVTAGVRRQSIQDASFDTATGDKTFTNEESVYTPVYAVVVKPTSFMSVYANYIEALARGPVVESGYANEGQIFPPFVTEQYEIGTKFDFGSVGITLAYFDISQQQSSADNTTTPPTFTVNGEQRNKGFEISVFGEPIKGVRILSGASIINSELSGTEDGLLDGNSATGVPKYQFVIGGEYDLPWVRGLTATGRVIHYGEQYVDLANNQVLPEWTRLDLGLRYEFAGFNGKPMILRANVENVLDEDYWASGSEGYLLLGQARTFLVSATTNF